MSNPIRREASTILDIFIGEDKWDVVFEQLNREGKPDKATTLKLILMLCKRVEELEKNIVPKDATTNGA